MFVTLRKGYSRARYPLLDKPIKIKGVELYQSLYGCTGQSEEATLLYDTPYVRENILSSNRYRSRIFMHCDNTLVHYPQAPSAYWLPENPQNYDELMFQVQLQVLDFQCGLLEDLPSTELLSIEKAKSIQLNFKYAKRINKMMATTLKRNWVKKLKEE